MQTSAVKLGRKSYLEGFGLAGRNSLLILPFTERVYIANFQDPRFREYFGGDFLGGVWVYHGFPGVLAFGPLWGPGPQLGFVVHKTTPFQQPTTHGVWLFGHVMADRVMKWVQLFTWEV